MFFSLLAFLYCLICSFLWAIYMAWCSFSVGFFILFDMLFSMSYLFIYVWAFLYCFICSFLWAFLYCFCILFSMSLLHCFECSFERSASSATSAASSAISSAASSSLCFLYLLLYSAHLVSLIFHYYPLKEDYALLLILGSSDSRISIKLLCSQLHRNFMSKNFCFMFFLDKTFPSCILTSD